MDVGLHSVSSGIICYSITKDITASIVVGMVNALPDLIGWLERVIKRNKGLWNWYRASHSLETLGLLFICTIVTVIALPDIPFIRNLIWLIPIYGLQYLIDVIWHKKDGGWYDWGLPVNILLWVGTIWAGIKVIFYG